MKLLTITQVAEKIGISQRYARQLAQRLRIGLRPSSRLILVSTNDIPRIKAAVKPTGNPLFGKKRDRTRKKA